ncbi:type II toxin-antitoxin system RelE/ParE family toxin [Salinimicrobium sp. CDJ15-81-2]|nr:type II toxin-antitoxin system RelE/ParE family toxin [Salinimicrobium nanhaiense]
MGKVKERIQLLKKNPAIGKPTEFKSTRILVMGHYSIIYKYFSFQILVTGFWDNRRDPVQLLRSLKKD